VKFRVVRLKKHKQIPKTGKKNGYIPEAANRINFRAAVTTSASCAKLKAVHGRAALRRPAYYRVHYGLL
jgi:hypothetical protein